ncbi:MAG: HDOD domain-containing protein [Gallionellaceae bacterium]|nr:MAG: HDOD domain-containing protein [Gallionellaceae bacterium]
MQHSHEAGKKMHTELSSDITEQTLLGISIPPCPASLTSIMREAKHPSADFASIAHLISRDAGVVGPLLKLANSPFIGLRSKVSSAFQAISVLGMQNTLNLVQNIALRQSLGGDTPSFEKFWERSSLSATIAEKIAAKFPTVSKDDAYLAALFHDCGIPVLMMKYPEYRETVMAQCKQGKSICDVENDTFSTSHTVVGNMLTRSWMLPAHICKAILYHHDPTIFTSASENANTDVCNLIGILHMAECIADEHLHVRDKGWHQFEHDVLKHFEMSAQEFLELKGDILAYLDGE